MKTSLIILVIQVCPYNQMRYPSAGDWYTRDGVTHIVVAKMSDRRYEMLLAIHELVEFWLCKTHGITEKQVDQFDIAWKEHNGYSEAGEDPKAPYHKEHMFAMKIERLMAIALNVNWEKYNQEVDTL